MLSILFFTVAFSSMATTGAQEGIKSEYVIVYDTSHGQYFTPDDFQGAFDSLSVLEDQFNITIIIREISEQFTSTNLQGADLLIISNPNFEARAADGEKQAIESFVQEGGSTLYLANPLAADEAITGSPRVLNEFLDDRFQPDARIQNGVTGQVDTLTVLADEIDKAANNESHVLINATETINEEAIINGVSPVEQVLYFGAGVLDSTQGGRSGIASSFTGNTSYTSYTLNDQSNVVTFNTLNNIKWMVGREYTAADGRSAAVGSTIMFSDHEYDSTTSWIDAYSNKALFQNLVAWLMKLTPVLEEAPTIDNDFNWFVGRTFFWGIMITLGFVALIFASQVIPGKLAVGEIFKVGREKKYVEKSSKKTKRKSTTSKKKKRQRRQRR